VHVAGMRVCVLGEGGGGGRPLHWGVGRGANAAVSAGVLVGSKTVGPGVRSGSSGKVDVCVFPWGGTGRVVVGRTGCSPGVGVGLVSHAVSRPSAGGPLGLGACGPAARADQSAACPRCPRSAASGAGVVRRWGCSAGPGSASSLSFAGWRGVSSGGWSRTEVPDGHCECDRVAGAGKDAERCGSGPGWDAAWRRLAANTGEVAFFLGGEPGGRGGRGVSAAYAGYALGRVLALASLLRVLRPYRR